MISGRTTRHAKPILDAQIKALGDQMQHDRLHTLIKGRKGDGELKDAIKEGMELLGVKKGWLLSVEEDENDVDQGLDDVEIDVDDVEVDLQD